MVDTVGKIFKQAIAVAEEALLGACFECQPVWVLSWLLHDRYGQEAEKAPCIGD